MLFIQVIDVLEICRRTVQERILCLNCRDSNCKWCYGDEPRATCYCDCRGYKYAVQLENEGNRWKYITHDVPLDGFWCTYEITFYDTWEQAEEAAIEESDWRFFTRLPNGYRIVPKHKIKIQDLPRKPKKERKTRTVKSKWGYSGLPTVDSPTSHYVLKLDENEAQARNQYILMRVRDKAKPEEVAVEVGLSPSRITQIVQGLSNAE